MLNDEPSRGRDARFQPGQSGNPGGRPNTAVAAALCRRYTVDALQTLVWAARLRIPSYAGASVTAAKTLVEWGYAGIGKQEDQIEGGALHQHLLAVMAGELPENTPVASEPLPVPESALEPLTIDMDLLAEPADALPGAALPLWDAYRDRARQRAIEAAAETPQEDTEPQEAMDDEPSA